MAQANGPAGWKADIYSKDFIPRAFTAVNDSPAIPLPPPAGMEVNFEAYVAAFAGSAFLEPLPKLIRPHFETSQPLTDVLRLSATSYQRFWANCLALEIDAYAIELDEYALFGVRLVPVSNTMPLYKVHFQALSDSHPTILLGQSIFVRQLIMDSQTNSPWGMDQWLSAGGGQEHGTPAPGFTGYEIEATVYNINKAQEMLILQAHGMMPFLQLVCNIQVGVHGTTFTGMQRAIMSIGALVTTNLESWPDSWMRRMLFPTAEDGLPWDKLSSHTFDNDWYDEKLNHEQRKAVHFVMKRKYGELPFHIYGPPGSGKTKTVCELVTQMAKDPAFRGSILLCAPSNPASDVLTDRLSARFEPREMLRLNDCSRTFAEVPDKLLPYCFVKDNIFNLPSPQDLMKKKIVVTTCRDADILVKARLTNRDIASLQRDVTRRLYPYYESSDTMPCHWLALIIDEAAQATEPETAISMTVVNPHPDYNADPSPAFVMAGDEHQLNARISNHATALKTSLFERLANKHLYSSHPLARKNFGRKLKMSTIIYPPFVNLTRNYRSHPAILALPSALFYYNTLIAEATQTESLLSWEGWRGPKRWPMLFACNGGIDDCETLTNFGTGWYNVWEVEKAIGCAKSLLQSRTNLAAEEICIMSPFPAQVRHLRQRARERGMYGLNIGPMEAFQGLESRVVIICTTRARTRFLAGDVSKGMGIIGNEKKFNVAITRAKEGLIVIGNPWTMATNYYWRQFLRFCHRNGLWLPEQADDERMKGLLEYETNLWAPATATAEEAAKAEPDVITSIESAYALEARDRKMTNEGQLRRLGGFDGSDGMWESGVDAEEIVAIGDRLEQELRLQEEVQESSSSDEI